MMAREMRTMMVMMSRTDAEWGCGGSRRSMMKMRARVMKETGERKRRRSMMSTMRVEDEPDEGGLAGRGGKTVIAFVFFGASVVSVKHRGRLCFRRSFPETVVFIKKCWGRSRMPPNRSQGAPGNVLEGLRVRHEAPKIALVHPISP